MKIDVRIKLLDYRGGPIREGSNRTFRDFVVIGLNNIVQGEVLTGEQKAKIYTISTKLYERNKVDLTLDERALIKERVEKTLPPLHAGRIIDVLNERASPPILSEIELTKVDDEAGPDKADAEGTPGTENVDSPDKPEEADAPA